MPKQTEKEAVKPAKPAPRQAVAVPTRIISRVVNEEDTDGTDEE